MSAVPEPEAEQWRACRGARVLVVDDDEDMRSLLATRLEQVGCHASALPTGVEALELLESAGGAEPVDLLLVDLRMPGLTGIDVLRRLLAVTPHVPAILMTGYAEADVRVDALALGVHVLEKPFTFDTLRRVASALIVSQRLERRRDSERPRISVRIPPR